MTFFLLGYHCSPRIVWRALSFCGIKTKKDLIGTGIGRGVTAAGLEGGGKVREFSRADLHLLVAHFLCLRFPIVLGLNKCDVGGGEDGQGVKENLRKIQEKFPHIVGVPMSARIHCILQELQREVCKNYDKNPNTTSPSLLPFSPSGHPLETNPHHWSPSLAVPHLEKTISQNGEGVMEKKQKTLLEAAQKGLKAMGEVGGGKGTGVEEVLRVAFWLKNPQVVCPVWGFDTLEMKGGEEAGERKGEGRGSGAGKGAGGKGKGKGEGKGKGKGKGEMPVGAGKDVLPVMGKELPPVLRETLIMRPGGTSLDVFEAMKRRGLLGGEFVRVERWKGVGGEGAVVKKKERLGGGAGYWEEGEEGEGAYHVLRISSNQRVKWQR